MRAKIHSILIGSVICTQVCAVGALAAAHPTHTLNRDSRRLVMPAPSRQTAHARHTPAPSRPSAHQSRAVASLHRGVGSSRHVAKTVAVASPSTADRVHAWEQAQHDQTSSDNTADQPVLSGTALVTSPELPRVPSIEQEASTPVILPSLYDKRGHLVMPPPLKGTHEILVHQNTMADEDGLTRVRDDEDLLDLRREQKLVPLPEGEALRVDERLPDDRRFSRPWTADFLSVLAHDFYDRFHEPLQVNSAVRTVDVQEHLLHTNGNAAPAEGETASPHLTGQAVDIGKRGLTKPEIAWMRDYLEPLIEQGKIDVEEEFKQSCFHISVYKSYEQASHLNLASTPASTPAAN